MFDALNHCATVVISLTERIKSLLDSTLWNIYRFRKGFCYTINHNILEKAFYTINHNILEKAFYTINHNILCDKRNYYGLRSNVYNY